MDLDVKLLVVYSKLSYQFIDKLGKDLEERKMPASTYAILAHLNNVEKSKTQKLGEVAFITSGTITHVVNKLVSNNLVRKVRDENDKRIYWIQITNKGRECFNEVDVEHKKYLSDLLSVFTNEEKEELIRQMKYFGKKLEERGKAK